jgi:hypothetical protein
MARVNNVILATHSVLANGGLVAAAGAKMIAQAAQVHQTPVVVLTGIYKLSPIYPFDVEELIEWGDAGVVARYEDAEFVEKVDVVNPVFDYVPPELVNLYISNLSVSALPVEKGSKLTIFLGVGMLRRICIMWWRSTTTWQISTYDAAGLKEGESRLCSGIYWILRQAGLDQNGMILGHPESYPAISKRVVQRLAYVIKCFEVSKAKPSW